MKKTTLLITNQHNRLVSLFSSFITRKWKYFVWAGLILSLSGWLYVRETKESTPEVRARKMAEEYCECISETESGDYGDSSINDYCKDRIGFFEALNKCKTMNEINIFTEVFTEEIGEYFTHKDTEQGSNSRIHVERTEN